MKKIRPLSVVLFVTVSALALAPARAQEESDLIGRRILRGVREHRWRGQ